MVTGSLPTPRHRDPQCCRGNIGGDGRDQFDSKDIRTDRADQEPYKCVSLNVYGLRKRLEYPILSSFRKKKIL